LNRRVDQDEISRVRTLYRSMGNIGVQPSLCAPGLESTVDSHLRES
jgi:hypothetical protein